MEDPNTDIPEVPMDTVALEGMTNDELRQHARDAGVPGARKMPREELIATLAGTDDAMTRSEERLTVDTEREHVGTARLRKHVVTEEVQMTVPVRSEEVRLEREPITDDNRGDA
jgi:stress response protein YsnF